MKPPKRIGIALSSRETSSTVFNACKRTFGRFQTKLSVARKLDFGELKKNADFLASEIIICFGGDGTFLKVAQAIQTKTPLFLVGTGERNRLSTIDAQEAPKKIEEILQGKYRTEKRFRLSSTTPQSPLALNEILIAPVRSATVMQYDLTIDGKRQGNDRADGVLVCTPTGSSAYFAATGGPIIETGVAAIGIAPLHSIDNTPKRICDSHKKIGFEKISSSAGIEAVFDGQQRKTCPPSIQIHLSNKPVWIGYPLNQQKPPKLEKTAWTPSARIVLSILENTGASTQNELAQKSGLNSRSIRRATQALLLKKKITKRAYFADKRQELYQLM